jgi:hypothetical protein
MDTSAAKVLQLRQLLAERFGSSPLLKEEVFPTGLPVLDDAGIPRASITEIVSSSATGPGGTLLLYGLLHAATEKNGHVILIDGKDSFAPQGLAPDDFRRLIWIRCTAAMSAIQAADLAVRDGNVPLVILLLTLNSASECRRIPATAWHRLQMLAEKSAVTLLVFTSRPQVGCARLRLSVGGAIPLDALHRCRRELLPRLSVRRERGRLHHERREDEALCRASCA